MNIANFKGVVKWPLEKLADAIVYLFDLLLGFLHSRGFSPVLQIRKKNTPSLTDSEKS